MKRLLLLATAVLVVAVTAVTPAAAQYRPMSCSVSPITIPAGGTFTITAAYFVPGSDVQIHVESDPVVLGSLVAQADGTASGSLVLPLGIAVGSHTIFATGTPLDAAPITEICSAITVIDAAVSPASATPAVSGSGALPQTGNDPAALVAIAAALLTAGGLLLMNHRNRRRAIEG